MEMHHNDNKKRKWWREKEDIKIEIETPVYSNIALDSE